MSKKKTKAAKKKSIWKSIGAVVAGFLVVVLLSTVTDSIVESVGIFPGASQPQEYQSWMYVFALLYRSVYTILGGYVTAMLAPRNAKKHVMVLGVLGTIGGVMGVLVGWNLSEHWYPIALAVTAYPLVWYGGHIRTTKSFKLTR